MSKEVLIRTRRKNSRNNTQELSRKIIRELEVSTIPKTVTDTSSEELQAITNDTEGESEGSRHDENDREIDTISTIPKTVSDNLPE